VEECLREREGERAMRERKIEREFVCARESERETEMGRDAW